MEVNSKQLQTPFEISAIQHRPGDTTVDLYIEDEVLGLNIGGGAGLVGALRIQNVLHTQAGQTALHATYTGFSRTSLVGALNALVDGTVPLGSISPNLTAVLTTGNITGLNDIVITSGQKITGQAELTLAAFGPNPVEVFANGALRMSVDAAGTTINGGLNMGGAASAATGQIAFAAGLGTVINVLGPSDQPLRIYAYPGQNAGLGGGANLAGAGGDGVVSGGNGTTVGGGAQVYGATGAIGGYVYVYAGEGTAGVGGDTYIDAGIGSTTHGVLYLGVSAGYNSAIHLGQTTVYTRVFGGLGMGGASAPVNGQIKWHTGLGAISQIEGPSDQTLRMWAGASRGVYILGGPGTGGANGGFGEFGGGSATGGGNGGTAQVYGGGGATAGDTYIYNQEGTVAAGNTTVDAGPGPGGVHGTVSIGAGSGYTRAVQISHAAGRLGFFGTAAIVQQAQPAADAAAIIAALTAYGLFSS